MTQMNYLNKALDLYNTAIVSPVYYVMFTVLTIVASLVLFRVGAAARQAVADSSAAGSGPRWIASTAMAPPHVGLHTCTTCKPTFSARAARDLYTQPTVGITIAVYCVAVVCVQQHGMLVCCPLNRCNVWGISASTSMRTASMAPFSLNRTPSDCDRAGCTLPPVYPAMHSS